MAIATWDASYTVKVTRYDDDHKKLFLLLSGLHDAILAGRGAGMVQQVVDELADYATYHFWAEESMMEKTNYPELASHRLQHREFAKRLEQLQRDLAAGTGGTISVAVFLNDWVTAHIKQTDQQYSAHLNANGIF